MRARVIAGDEGKLLPSYPVWHQERFITLDIQHIKQRKSEERGGRRNEVFPILLRMTALCVYLPQEVLTAIASGINSWQIMY